MLPCDILRGVCRGDERPQGTYILFLPLFNRTAICTIHGMYCQDVRPDRGPRSQQLKTSFLSLGMFVFRPPLRLDGSKIFRIWGYHYLFSHRPQITRILGGAATFHELPKRLTTKRQKPREWLHEKQRQAIIPLLTSTHTNDKDEFLHTKRTEARITSATRKEHGKKHRRVLSSQKPCGGMASPNPSSRDNYLNPGLFY